MIKYFTIILSLVVLISLGQAETYYVSQNGSNSNSGTSAQPWATIQHAVDQVVAGDEIIVRQGTYSGGVTVRTSGTSGQRITIRAESGVIFNGNIRFEASYITFDGFEITDNGGQTAIRSSANANNVHILNCSIHDTGQEGRYIDLPRSTGTPTSPANWLIKGNHFYGQTMMGLYAIFGGVGHVIEENEIGPGVVYEDAFRPFGDNHVIRNNYIHDMTSGGGHTDIFQIFNDNGWRVRNLVFEKNYVDGWQGQAWMADVTTDSEGIIVRNNVFINVRSAGNSYCPRTLVYNNTFINCGYGNCQAVRMRSAAGRGSATNSAVKNNIFYNCGCDNNDGWYSVDAGATAGFEGDYNIVYPQKSGFDEANGINGADPLFSTSTDFHLQQNSPAINNGTVVEGYNDDIEGKIRNEPWDIGAYEYGGAGTALSVPNNIRIRK